MQHTSANNAQLIDPPYHILGQMIHSIDVVEAWGLNYHLSCALKCISLSGSKNFEEIDTETNLNEALWYLDRFLRLYIEQTAEHNIVTPHTIEVLDISIDWGLDCDLTMAVMHLFHSTKDRTIYHINAAKRFILYKLERLRRAVDTVKLI
ncbi:hypothetical protein [Shewanella vesiculosa]|uniref:hypothetical protein n=1 Tax=Shewanella vesiculosa TaxID=518738 RepID=UPI002359DA6B|nr:hypothetical protein [Shewanella vesiculosa]NCP76438.1 hypothetical protein [Shewanella vesiculosa]